MSLQNAKLDKSKLKNNSSYTNEIAFSKNAKKKKLKLFSKTEF